MSDPFEESEPTNPFGVNSAENWEDLNSREDYNDKERDAWVYHQKSRETPPHQGWKIHVSAEPEDGREVIETVGTWLRDNSASHKWVESRYRLERFGRTGQKNKAVTIYPEIDEDRFGEITHELEENGNRFQLFRYDNEDFNRRSINSNLENTSAMIHELMEVLEDQDLLYGPKIEVHNDEEFQVGDTRVHYRYATSGTDGLMEKDGELYSVTDDNIIGASGSIISTEYYAQPPEAAEHPIDLNWVEEIRFTKTD